MNLQQIKEGIPRKHTKRGWYHPDSPLCFDQETLDMLRSSERYQSEFRREQGARPSQFFGSLIVTLLRDYHGNTPVFREDPEGQLAEIDATHWLLGQILIAGYRALGLSDLIPEKDREHPKPEWARPTEDIA